MDGQKNNTTCCKSYKITTRQIDTVSLCSYRAFTMKFMLIESFVNYLFAGFKKPAIFFYDDS